MLVNMCTQGQLVQTEHPMCMIALHAACLALGDDAWGAAETACQWYAYTLMRSVLIAAKPPPLMLSSTSSACQA